MAKGKKSTDEIKERAFAEYAVCGNYKEVAKKLKVPYSTVRGWIKSKPPDELDNLRNEKKKEFIEGANEFIKNGVALMNRRVKTAIEKECELEKIIDEIYRLDPREVPEQVKQLAVSKLRTLQVQDIKSIAVAVGTMYDKRALAEGSQEAEKQGGIIFLPQVEPER